MSYGMLFVCLFLRVSVSLRENSKLCGRILVMFYWSTSCETRTEWWNFEHLYKTQRRRAPSLTFNRLVYARTVWYQISVYRTKFDNSSWGNSPRPFPRGGSVCWDFSPLSEYGLNHSNQCRPTFSSTCSSNIHLYSP